MNFFNLFKIAYKALLRNKTRALLTMLGIIIGIASVIAMVSLGETSSKEINSQISATGSGLIMVTRANQSQGGVNIGADNVQSLTDRDAEALLRGVPYISVVSPVVSAGGQLVYGPNNWPGNLQGGNEHLIAIRNFEIERGSNFTEHDVHAAAKVCIIGKTVIDNLFPNEEDPVGKTIRFGKIPFRIIGTLVGKGNQLGQDQDDTVIVPYTTIQKRILAINYVHMIMASAVSDDVVIEGAQEIEDVLRERHRIKADQDADFEVRTQQELLDMLSNVTGMLSMLLAAIASISLIVGGIGIMNIMYVTVTERTKEIGLRMSIGARNRDIKLQFLTESTILSLIGGVVGIVFGMSLYYCVTAVLGWIFVVSYQAVFIAFTVCAATGIFFGWYPARKAASLDPIIALRYE
jgi:putative ABC transport system permease protein